MEHLQSLLSQWSHEVFCGQLLAARQYVVKSNNGGDARMSLTSAKHPRQTDGVAIGLIRRWCAGVNLSVQETCVDLRGLAWRLERGKTRRGEEEALVMVRGGGVGGDKIGAECAAIGSYSRPSSEVGCWILEGCTTDEKGRFVL